MLTSQGDAVPRAGGGGGDGGGCGGGGGGGGAVQGGSSEARAGHPDQIQVGGGINAVC